MGKVSLVRRYVNPDVAYEFAEIRIEGDSVHEFNALKQEYYETNTVFVFPETPTEGTGATESVEEVLDEGEALEALKTALGATEAPQTVVPAATPAADW